MTLFSVILTCALLSVVCGESCESGRCQLDQWDQPQSSMGGPVLLQSNSTITREVDKLTQQDTEKQQQWFSHIVKHGYTLVDAGTSCAEHELTDIPSAAECRRGGAVSNGVMEMYDIGGTNGIPKYFGCFVGYVPLGAPGGGYINVPFLGFNGMVLPKHILDNTRKDPNAQMLCRKSCSSFMTSEGCPTTWCSWTGSTCQSCSSFNTARDCVTPLCAWRDGSCNEASDYTLLGHGDCEVAGKVQYTLHVGNGGKSGTSKAKSDEKPITTQVYLQWMLRPVDAAIHTEYRINFEVNRQYCESLCNREWDCNSYAVTQVGHCSLSLVKDFNARVSLKGSAIQAFCYRKNRRTMAGKITDLTLMESSTCPSGFEGVDQVSSLNGNLNQGAGGKYIYLCKKTERTPKTWINDLRVSVSSTCPRGFQRVDQVSQLNGDLNQGAGGKHIYLCKKTTSSGTWITDLALDQSWGCETNSYRVDMGLGRRRRRRRWFQIPPLNGDLNQRAGGKHIYLCKMKFPWAVSTMALESNSCSTDAKPITDSAQCKAAAESLGVTWKGSERSENWPKGCYEATFGPLAGAWFNSHGSGRAVNTARPICRQQ